MGAKRHRRTLSALFSAPTPSSIAWSEIEAMLAHFGADVSEREGSRVAISLNGRVAVFHRPHPEKEASKSLVRAVRDFCEECGLEPEQ